MSTTTDLAQHAIIRQIVKQVRANDTYGQYDRSTTEELIAPFIVTKEQKHEIPIVGDPDEQTIERVREYYNAISSLVEERTGLMAIPMMSLTHEGFGRSSPWASSLSMTGRCATSIATVTARSSTWNRKPTRRSPASWDSSSATEKWPRTETGDRFAMSTSTLSYVGRTRGGAEWYPRYVMALDQSRCIGCGRCFKSCSRSVFQLVARETDEDDDCDETSKVMQIADAFDCIGCEACGKVCPKSCLTHESVEQSAEAVAAR